MYKIPANTLFMGKNLVYVPVCDSTNTLAAELSNKASLPEGTVVITDQQLAGRGQRGNGWEAAPQKNLTLSLVLKPTFLAIPDQFLLNQCISLALHDLIQAMVTPQVRIKWPNDILVNEKKVCGLLIENSLSSHTLQQSIVGIGININQQKFESALASSLSLICKTEFSLSVMLDELLGTIEARYLQLKRNERATIHQDYLRVLYRINEPHRYSTPDSEFEGTIIGVDSRGRLKIMERAAERVFDVKQVRFVM